MIGDCNKNIQSSADKIFFINIIIPENILIQ